MDDSADFYATPRPMTILGGQEGGGGRPPHRAGRVGHGGPGLVLHPFWAAALGGRGARCPSG